MADDFDNKLKILKDKINQAKPKSTEYDRKKPESAFSVSVELMAGVLVGVVLGYLIDQYLDTKPIFMVIFLLFGAMAGFWNIIRRK